MTSSAGSGSDGSELPAELDLAVGGQFRSPITGAASQGFHWLVSVAGDQGAVEVSTTPVPPPEREGQGSFPLEFRIVARAAGVARVHLVLLRGPDIESGLVREEHDVIVRVRASKR